MSLKKRLAVGVLSLSATGLIGIASYEGFSEKAYIPIKGDVPTIGFGSTEGVKMGDAITVPQALDRLRRDITVAESAISRCVRVPLSQGELDAYTSLAFNIGTDAFCRSTLVVKLNGGDYAGACEEIKRWVYAGGRRVPGLVARREKEYATCVGDVR
nr:MAG TPA: lysozyme [Caudoviricetes sp.]